MIPIRKTFRSDGFDFTQIWRVGNIALYSKTKPGWESTFFEVVKIESHPDLVICGRLSPAREHMPWSGDWGEKGWSYSDRASAERKLNSLTKDLASQGE